MSVPFTPVGASIIAPYADDSSETSITIAAGSSGLPTVLYCVNPDTANVVVVNYGFSDEDTQAVVPTSGSNGQGVVIAAAGTAMIRVPQSAYIQGSLFVSVAGVSATGNVYITPGLV